MSAKPFLTVIACLGILGCGVKRPYRIYQGPVFGTSYRFQIESGKDFSAEIDSVFMAIDLAANTYDEASEISRFNHKGRLDGPSTTFVQMLDSAKKFHSLTDRYFNPALYPLIDAWGSALGHRSRLDSAKVDSLLGLIDLDRAIFVNDTKVEALQKGAMLDLSGLGEGFALDRIAQLLKRNKVQNFMIEIGGEMHCRGVNGDGKVWRIGIEDPKVPIKERGTSLMKIVKLGDRAISTSGSYRKFYTDSLGNKYPHIIDPKNGYPVKHRLLSASIISSSSTEADAIATACMAMGTGKAKSLLKSMPHLSGFLIYDGEKGLETWQTSNFPQ